VTLGSTSDPKPSGRTATVRVDAGRSAYLKAHDTRTGSEREQEVLRHLPLVHTVVERIAAHLPNTVDRDDLFHAGVIGLIDAISRFDPGRDTAFSTYAVLRIRGQVIDELRARDWVPRAARERAREYQQAVAELSQTMGRTPSDAELAKRLGVAEADLADLEAQSHLASQVSLDAPIGEETPLGATLARRDDEDADPSRHIDLADRKRILARVLGTLTDQERMVIKLYYFEQLLMKEIAAVLGVTESRVCQIHARVITSLRSKVQGLDLF
jgi:RNA polymerase sigma factor for flagellar operon FliA